MLLRRITYGLPAAGYGNPGDMSGGRATGLRYIQTGSGFPPTIAGHRGDIFLSAGTGTTRSFIAVYCLRRFSSCPRPLKMVIVILEGAGRYRGISVLLLKGLG